MARRKLTELEKALATAKRLGVTLPNITIPNTDTEGDKALEAEAVILYFDLRGKGFEHQICPVCNQEFAYKYRMAKGKMRCSMRCRRVELEAKGIKWRPGLPLEQRWARAALKGELPLIVPPEALQAVRNVHGDAL